MNTMTHAIVSAGIKVASIKQRFWGFIQEHPQTTAAATADEFSMEADTARKVLWTMVRDGSLTSKHERVGRREYLCYSVNGDRYMPTRPRPVVVATIKPEEKTAVADIRFGGEYGAKAICERLTIAELFALRSYINSILR